MKEYLVCERCGHIVKDYGQEMRCDRCNGKMILVDISEWRSRYERRTKKTDTRPKEDS